MDAFQHLLQNKAPGEIRLYFMGIGGISMYGLARYAASQGFQVAGSDNHPSERTEHLRQEGMRIFDQQVAENLAEAQPDVVIYTAAIPVDHPERREAEKRGIPLLQRGEFLGWMSRNYPRSICIAGTHGKTTTTAMTASILLADEASLHPTVHIGASLDLFQQETIHLEETDLFVTEACEYCNSYHDLRATTAVILNIDEDHMDFFQTMPKLIHSFALFALNIDEGGTLILPANAQENILQLLSEMRMAYALEEKKLPRLLTFGFDSDPADLQARRLSLDATGSHFEVWYQSKLFTTIDLPVPGRHNVLNALAAIAASIAEGAHPEACKTGLANFHSAEGRFSRLGQVHGAELVADYAHHPSSTRVTIEAAENLPHQRLLIVYQPLTFDRVKRYFDHYIQALDRRSIEQIYFCEIYSDREQDRQGMSSKLLVEALQKRGKNVKFYPNYEELKKALLPELQAGDLVLFLGPEEVRSYAARLLREESEG